MSNIGITFAALFVSFMSSRSTEVRFLRTDMETYLRLVS